MLFSWLEYIFTPSIIRYIILWLLLLYSIKTLYTLSFVTDGKFISDTIASICFTTIDSIIEARRLSN